MKSITLKNKTDVLGFVYNADVEPAAVLQFKSSPSTIVSVHALRAYNESLLAKMFELAKVDINGEFEVEAFFHARNAGVPSGHVCYGMYYGPDGLHREIGEIDQWAVKLHEHCA